jgi:aryl-alcohol dehydrogenase (NADP+)
MVAIKNTEIDVFPVSLGGNTFGWTADQAASFEIMDDFTAGGGNMIDTADAYSSWVPGNTGGESETVIGNWLKARGGRERVVIATKVGKHPQFQGLAPANIKAACDASLKRLQTDFIDIYYAHADDPSVPLEESVAAFEDLVKAGKILHPAISNFTPVRINEWLTVAADNNFHPPVALQPEYSLVKRVEYETGYEPIAKQTDIAVFTYFSLASGFLTGKYRKLEDLKGQAREGMAAPYATPAGFALVDKLVEIADAHEAQPATIALSWLLSRPTVTAPIASASKRSQVEPLLEAPGTPLSIEEIKALDQLSQGM